jgi:hypothetical protein
LQHSIAFQDAGSVPRVQIIPVLRCGSKTGAALLLHHGRTEGATAKTDLATDVVVVMQPVSTWCSLPLLSNLQSLAGIIQQQVAGRLRQSQRPTPLSDLTATDGTAMKGAVAGAIKTAISDEQCQYIHAG